VVVTDDSVYSLLPPKNYPPTLPAMVLLEKEIYLKNFDFTHSNEYVRHIYKPNSQVGKDISSSDLNIDLLLGNQGWRYGFFFPDMIEQWPAVVVNMTYQDRY